MVRILKTNYFNYFSIFCIWTQVKNKINVVASWVNAQNDSKRPKLSFWVKIRNLKGQIKQEADWRAIDSHKKRTNEFVLFAFLLFTAKKKQSCSFNFWENLRHAQTAFGFIWPLDWPSFYFCKCTSSFSIFRQTSPKVFLASKCDVGIWIFSKSWEFMGNSLRILWEFLCRILWRIIL